MDLRIVGKISGLMTKTQESDSKTNSFTSAEGYATNKGVASKHIGKSTWVFIPDTTLPPSPIVRSQGSQSFLINYR
jgi:hypothetical protein